MRIIHLLAAMTALSGILMCINGCHQYCITSEYETAGLPVAKCVAGGGVLVLLIWRWCYRVELEMEAERAAERRAARLKVYLGDMENCAWHQFI